MTVLDSDRVDRGEVEDGEGRERYISPSTDIGSLGLVDEGRIVGRGVILIVWSVPEDQMVGRKFGEDGYPG